MEEDGEEKMPRESNDLESIGEKRMFLNNILHRKANWIGHILRRNCFLYDVING